MTFWCTFWLTIGVAFSTCLGDHQRAGDPVRAYNIELSQLASEARDAGHAKLAKEISDWYICRDPERQYLFGTAEGEAARPDWENNKYWDKFIQLRQEQAISLWKVADHEFETGDLERALQIVHELLREDPDNVRARAMLGFEQREDGWLRTSRTTSVRPGKQKHPKFGWPAGSYWKIDSEHFQIVTNHSSALASGLAATLEDFHNGWRQLFTRFWLNRAAFGRVWNGQSSVPAGRKRFRIVVFRDRDEYVRSLKSTEPNIDISMGVYLHRRRATFLYADEQADLMSTWRHEVTHQLLHETLKAGGDVGGRSNFWIIEGIALYMESWHDFGSYVTVGGIDAERLQYARHRALSDGFQLPVADMVALSREALQTDSRIRQIYSQAAGMAHFLIDGDGGRYRDGVLSYLRKVYAAHDELTTLAAVVGRSYQELDSLYLQYLNVNDERLLSLPEPGNVTMLHFGDTQITDAGIKAIRVQSQLQWLDLSGCPITDEGLHWMANHGQIQELYLHGTLVSDASIETLKTLSNLKILDVSETNVSAAGLSRLVETLPHLKVVQ